MPLTVKTPVIGAAISVAIVAVVSAASQTTWDGVFTTDQALEGAGIYQHRCSTCHGSDLEGGEDAPPLAGAQFSTVWEGRMLGELLVRTERGMPKDAPASLGRAAYTNILAFLLEKNGFPPGTTKLPSDAALLNGIRYLTVASAR